MSISEREWAVLDLEATGLDTAIEKIVSVAVIVLSPEGLEQQRWTSLINPGIPMKATEIHGLDENDVADAPSFAQISAQLAELLEGRILVSHNTQYDALLLQAEFDRVGISPNPAGVMCTLRWARRAWPELSSWSLASLAARAGIKQHAAHTAEEDTMVLVSILGQLRTSGVSAQMEAWGQVGASRGRFGSAKIARIPVAWANPGVLNAGVGLIQGMRVVFSGGVEIERIHLARAAQKAGLDVVEWLAASTSLLVAEEDALSSKTTKAAKLGIPRVSYEEFAALLETVAAGELTPTTTQPVAAQPVAAQPVAAQRIKRPSPATA